MVVKVKSNASLLCTWHHQPQYHRALELLCYALLLAKPQKWWTHRLWIGGGGGGGGGS